jgi:hypothetical protein
MACTIAGRPSLAAHGYDMLIHGRNIRRKAAINYRRWIELRDLLHRQRWTIGWIGSGDDWFEPLCGWDLRGLELQKLMDVIAASGVVIGVSSGLMHWRRVGTRPNRMGRRPDLFR